MGFLRVLFDLPPCVQPFWKSRDALYLGEDGVIMYNRVVIPKILRQQTLEILHAAHQGVSSMESRAQAIVYWPGLSTDIKETRSECHVCCRNAPSQAATHPQPATIPQIPAI